MRVASRTGILRSCLMAASSNSILQAKFATYLLERVGPAFAAGAALQRPLCKIDILQILEMLFERFLDIETPACAPCGAPRRVGDRKPDRKG